MAPTNRPNAADVFEIREMLLRTEILAFARQNGVLGVARIKPEFTE